MNRQYLFTSESVTDGHPDKMADQVSDAILDAIMADDPFGRVACECLMTTGLCLVSAEITTACYVHIPEIVRNVIKDVGYDNDDYGYDYKTCAVITSIDGQSPDIARGVNKAKRKKQGAGDQGLMFGYACRETKELMPLPIMLAHGLVRRLGVLRRNGKLPWARPDGKSQVTVEYVDGKPVRVDTVVVATQHSPDVSNKKIREDVIEKVILPVIPKKLLNPKKKVKYHINPTGRFEQGGPKADTGLTGRKIIVDTYGGVGRHGGGCFSGKDPSKVDRSASYAARYVAKNVVAAGLADVCEFQIAYAIGIAEPVSIMVDTKGTFKIPPEKLVKVIRDTFDLTPEGIIEHLDLRRPIFRQTAAYGHFGREEKDFTWEKLDKVEELKSRAGIR